jgi:hypothetical protein
MNRHSATLLGIAVVLMLVAAGVWSIEQSQMGAEAGRPPVPRIDSGAPAALDQMHELSGIIQSAQAGQLTLHTVQPVGTTASTIVVRQGTTTTVILQVARSQAQYQAELNAYQAAHATSSASGTNVATPPLPFTAQAASFAQLAPGMLISVIVVSGTPANATTVVAEHITAMRPAPQSGAKSSAASAMSSSK